MIVKTVPPGMPIEQASVLVITTPEGMPLVLVEQLSGVYRVFDMSDRDAFFKALKRYTPEDVPDIPVVADVFQGRPL